MKKYLLIATVTLGLSLTACGGGQKTESAQPADAAQPVVTATTDSTAAVNPDSVATPADSTVAPATKQ